MLEKKTNKNEHGQNFILVQIQSICRQQNNCELIKEFCIGNDRKHVEKGENAGHQHFLFFPQCFQKRFFLGVLKVGIVWERSLNTDST